MIEADAALFLLVSSFAGSLPLVDKLLSIAMSDYAIPVGLALLAVWLWFRGPSEERQKNQKVVLTAILAILIANIIVSASNQVFYRPRPFDSLQVRPLFYKARDSSFPSNSVAVAFALATAISFGSRRLGLFGYFLAGLLAFGRVYGGVHYPLDVLGGGIIGYVSAQMARMLLYYLDPAVALILRVARRLYLA